MFGDLLNFLIRDGFYLTSHLRSRLDFYVPRGDNIRMSEAHPPFFDLQKKLTSDPKFCEDVKILLADIAEAHASGNVEKLKRKNTELLRLCAFNPSLFLPYFFPNFQDGKPMTLWARPHAFAMMAMIPNGSLTIAASRQIGKCVTGDTEVTAVVSGERKKLGMKELFNLCKRDEEKRKK